MSRYSVREARFEFEARTAAQIPPAGSATEVAFAGRSNVGKSSLLNMLCQRASLARTSRTPGCTRGIIGFHVSLSGGLNLRLVDLPGYGFAQRSKTERTDWQDLIENYLGSSRCRLVLILVDARRGMESEERELIDYLDHVRVHYLVVVTKTDQIRPSERTRLVNAIAASARARVIATSSEDGTGRDEVWGAIARQLTARKATTT